MVKLSILVITAVLIWQALDAPAFARQPGVVQPQDLKEHAKVFINTLLKGDFTGAVKQFDLNMKAALPADKLQEAWNSVVIQAGSFKRQVGVRAEKSGPYDVTVVTCEFEKGIIDVRVVFDSRRAVAGLFFVPNRSSSAYESPSYVISDVFQERDITIGSGKWALPGTLCLPVGEGSFPAVVLVHGSGPHDRDESIGPNKPFRDLAGGLASRKIAVLRYEKRTKTHSAELASLGGDLTVMEETIEDALAAVSLLRNTPGINRERIYLLGHSLGGMLIPRIGILDREIAGFIIMAGTTRPLEDVILEQVRYIIEADGLVSESEAMYLEQIQYQVTKVKDPMLSSAASPTELPLGIPPKYWLDLRGYNPREVAKSLMRPMLIMQGERDYQVTLEDLAGWKNALTDHREVEFKVYGSLNHLFIEGEGKSTPAEYERAGHVAPIIINDIAEWIHARSTE